MAERHFINAAGGNWSSTACWSATAGGVGGASIPGETDDVFCSGGVGISPAGSVNQNFTIKSMTMLMFDDTGDPQAGSATIRDGITLIVLGALVIEGQCAIYVGEAESATLKFGTLEIRGNVLGGVGGLLADINSDDTNLSVEPISGGGGGIGRSRAT